MDRHITDRDDRVQARILRTNVKGGMYFSLITSTEEVRGPHLSYEEAVDDARTYLNALQSLSLWDSMIDT
jgi:hypothetical protein